ncbi:hypothetical protein [Halocola ammonii]
MDFGTAIVGAIAILLCALPFAMMNRSKSQKKKQFLASLSKIASSKSCKVDQHEIFGTFAIGLDESRNMVFFSRAKNNQYEEQLIDLHEIGSCRVINTTRTFRNSEGVQKVIDRLELSLTPLIQSQPEIKLEFFNADVSLQLYDELLSIEQWASKIGERLKNK